MAPQRTAANQPAGQVLPLLASAHRMICGAVYFLARPVSGMRTYSRYADNNFAKMRSRGHVPVGRLRLVEGKYLIDYRLNAARRYRTAHRLKHLHGTD